MSKNFYQFNPKTLTYNRVYVSISQKIWIVFRQLIIGIGMGGILFGIATYFFDSPRERQLKKYNKLLLTQYEVLRRRIAENEKILSDLQERDDMLYRAIFNANPVPEAIRRPGFGGTNRYEFLLDIPNSELVISTTRNLDLMTKALYSQSNSFDELKELVKNKDDRMKCIPAIVPTLVTNNSQYTSGYGMRTHPLSGNWQMHYGQDISTNSGSPIFATGDGVVESAQYKGEYGNCIIIDHGFGYKTLYGHCKDMLVKKGQKVTRKQNIATVGMTGAASGNHVHYEVFVKGKTENPAKYFFMELSPEDYNEVLFISESR